MELCNELSKLPENDPQSHAVEREALLSAVLMLLPIIPHVAHQLWAELGQTGDILDAQWPAVDESALVRSSITIVVQVNGKVRGRIDVAPDISKEDAVSVLPGGRRRRRLLPGRQSGPAAIRHWGWHL